MAGSLFKGVSVIKRGDFHFIGFAFGPCKLYVNIRIGTGPFNIAGIDLQTVLAAVFSRITKACPRVVYNPLMDIKFFCLCFGGIVHWYDLNGIQQPVGAGA